MSDVFEPLLCPLAQAAHGPLLFFDTAHSVSSAALITPQRFFEVAFGHASRPSDGLMDAVERLLKQAGLSRRDVRGLIVGVGPGSFTGVRVALATAKGLCQGLGCPLLGASSLALLALNAGPGLTLVGSPIRQDALLATLVATSPTGDVTTLIDEGVYESDELLGLVRSLLPEAAQPLRLMGDALRYLEEPLGPMPCVSLEAPRASLMALLVQTKLRAQAWDAPETLMPRYLSVSTPERLMLARQKANA